MNSVNNEKKEHKQEPFLNNFKRSCCKKPSNDKNEQEKVKNVSLKNFKEERVVFPFELKKN